MMFLNMFKAKTMLELDAAAASRHAELQLESKFSNQGAIRPSGSPRSLPSA